jgi:hypothetical protein
VSEYVALCLPLPGVVVSWFVTSPRISVRIAIGGRCTGRRPYPRDGRTHSYLAHCSNLFALRPDLLPASSALGGQPAAELAGLDPGEVARTAIASQNLVTGRRLPNWRPVECFLLNDLVAKNVTVGSD